MLHELRCRSDSAYSHGDVGVGHSYPGSDWALIEAPVGLLIASAPLADFYPATYLIFRGGVWAAT
jgi:hypothetical protein